MLSATLQSILAASLTWLTVFACASWAGSLLFNAFRSIARHTPAHERSSLFLLYALLPALVATAVATTLYIPGIANLFLPAHCHAGDCSPHAPQFAVNAAYGAMSAAIGIAAVSMLFYLPLRQLRRNARTTAIFKRLAAPAAATDLPHDFHIVDNDAALAWCDGLIRTRVFVSRGLLEKVDAEELKIVLAHEMAHAERLDNLARVLIDWSSRLWPGRQLRMLRDDFGTAAEYACDYAAASDGKLADVIRVIDKLGNRHASSKFTTKRINALMDSAERSSAIQAAPLFFLLGLCLIQTYLLAMTAHSTLEWLSL